MKQHCLIAFFSAAFLVFPHSLWGTNSCFKTKMSGDKCANLSVEFDLSECGDVSSGKPKVSCKDDVNATASLTTEKAEYRADFKSSSDWGGYALDCDSIAGYSHEGCEEKKVGST